MESNHNPAISEGSVQSAGVCDDAASASVSASRDEQQVVQQVIIRSYECSFCKKGFSNAQALGGHMNIHRKDKAKLKQAAKDAAHHHHHHRDSRLFGGTTTTTSSRQFLLGGGGGKKILMMSRKLGGIGIDQETEVSSFPSLTNESQMAMPMPLSLFVEKTATTNNNNNYRCNSKPPPPGQKPLINISSANWQQQLVHHSTNGGNGSSSSLTADHLDLELRLGRRLSPSPHQPPPESTSVTTYQHRKFS